MSFCGYTGSQGIGRPMNSIFLLIAFFALAIFLIMIGSIWLMNFFAKKFIVEKHMVLDEVTQGKVPEHWSRKFEARRNTLKENGQEAKIIKLKKKANISYLKKLNSLITYVQKTNLIDHEDTRSNILADLERTRIEWKENKTHEV